MNIGDPAFDPTTFSKNRERLLDHEVAHRFVNAVRAEAERRQLLSDDHFTVDGTLLDAGASVKSVRPNDHDSSPPSGRNPEVDFHGQRRRNDTHQSTTDPEARSGQEEPRHRGQAELRRAPAHGEPQRAGGGCRAHPS